MNLLLWLLVFFFMLLWLARGFHSHFSYLSFLLHRVFSLLLKLYSCSLFLENVYPHSVIGEDLMCVSWGCLPFTILLILTQSQWSIRSFLWRNGWDLRRSGQPVTTKLVSANNISLLESFLNISWVQEFTWIHIPWKCQCFVGGGQKVERWEEWAGVTQYTIRQYFTQCFPRLLLSTHVVVLYRRVLWVNSNQAALVWKAGDTSLPLVFSSWNRTCFFVNIVKMDPQSINSHSFSQCLILLGPNLHKNVSMFAEEYEEESLLR